MGNRITVDSLNYASTVADVGSFNSAARRLGVTQPALSTSVAKLEDYLGSRLFDRTAKGITLTNFGEEVLPRIRHALLTISDIEVSAHEFLTTKSQTIRVGVSPKIDKSIIASISELIHRPDPSGRSFSMVLLEAERRDLEKKLNANSLDLVIAPTEGRFPEYSYHHLYTDRLCLVDRCHDERVPDSPSDDGTVTLPELAQIPLIMCEEGCEVADYLASSFTAAGLVMARSEYRVSNCSALVDWSERKLGAVVVPASMVKADCPSRDVVDARGVALTINYNAVWHPNSDHSLYIAGIVKQLMNDSGLIVSLNNPS